MRAIKLNKDLLSLVENKRVALIGPAPHLIGRGLGKILDEYDVICRMNEIIPSSEYRCDYGSRTDIMFHNCSTPSLSGLKNKIMQSPKEYSELKMACCLATKASNSPHDNNYLNWPDDYVSDVVRNFSSVNLHNIPFYWIGVKDYRAIYDAARHQPFTGTSTIAVLSQYPTKELLITGMTFQLTGDTHDELYVPGHWDKQDLASRPTHGWHGGFHGPGYKSQVKFLKKIISTRGGVTIDSVMCDLLSLAPSDNLQVLSI